MFLFFFFYLDGLDLEPSREIVDETKGEYGCDGGERVAHRANGVDLERKRDVDPAIDRDGACQIDRVELERGEDRMHNAVDEQDKVLVGMIIM